MNAKQIWQAALGELEGRVSRPNFDTWVKHVGAVSLENGVFTLSAPSTFAQEWLEQRLLPQIKEVVGSLTGRAVDVQVIVGEPTPRRKRGRRSVASPTPDLFDESVREGTTEPGLTDSIAQPIAVSGNADINGSVWRPNPRYTFASFIVGSSNQLSHAAAMSVAEHPGHSYNPLFIYGGVGLGKTHLMHAIAHDTLARGRRAVYVTSEEFTNDLINAIRERRTGEFRAHYRQSEILLIDDVQFIVGKEATQEEFFHTFNALHTASRQIVLSSDRPPRAFSMLEDRLRSRFEWGLIADVQPPDLETRMAILQAKAYDQPVPIPPEVIAFLAQRIQSNIRELEGSLNRVVAYAQLSHRALIPETAAAALSDVMAIPARRYLDAVQIVDAVARYFKVEPRTLRSKARGREVSLPRQVAMYLLREETDSSLTGIGRELGGRDHSTVLHGCNKIQAEIEVNVQLRKDVLAVRQMLHSSGRP